MNELIFYLALSLLLNMVLFVVAFKKQSDKLTDASYALSFMLLAVAAAVTQGFNAYVVVGLALIILWATRIGSFLVYRVIKTGKDARFDAFRSSFFGFMHFWLLQGITAWVLLLPLFFAFSSQQATISVVSAIGLIIVVAGIVVESVADIQKWRFSQVASNQSTWIETGIWRYSRHPNYFGEIMVWCGLFIYAAPVLTSAEFFVSLISPLAIISLLLFVTGIPILEKSADKRWGSIKAYREYKYRTSILVPLPPRRK